MKIAHAEVLVTSPGRNFVTLRITTDDGVVGLGDATLNGRELAVAAYLTRPRRTAADRPRRAPRSRTPGSTSTAARTGGAGRSRWPPIAAVDMALWDIKAQGRRPAAVPAARRREPRRAPRLRARQRARPARAVRLDPRAPGPRLPGDPHPDRRARPRPVYGVAGGGDGDRYDYEPAAASAAARRGDLGHPRLPAPLPTVFEAVRNEFGPELPLLHDGHHRMTPIQAARLGKSLEPYDLFWLEDCTPAENQEALRLVRQHTTTPLAIGEVFNTVFDYQTLITRAADRLRPLRGDAHRRHHARCARSWTSPRCTRSSRGSHGPTDISPVGMAAALHLDLAIHNFGIQEYMRHSAGDRRGVPARATPSPTASCTPATRPASASTRRGGRGAAIPYSPAYLPVNRLTDGTVHDW